MVDLGTGNNNKINWAMDNKQEVSFYSLLDLYGVIADANSRWIQLIDIIETVYRGAAKGRGLVVSPKGMLHFVPDVWDVVLTVFLSFLFLAQITRLD